MVAVSLQDIEVDLSAAEFDRGIPFGCLAELRRRAPLFWHEADQCWLVTSYELVGQINRNPAVFSSRSGSAGAAPNALTARMLVNMDPPEHTRYRRLVSSSFTPRAMRNREEMVRRQARELVDRFVSTGGGDWVTEVATPLPFRVMSELMGISRDDEAAILERVNAQGAGVEPAPSTDGDALTARSREYADRLLEEHRRLPRGDLVDQLLDARIAGKPLTQEDLRAWVSMYIGGGAETTRHLIAHGLVCLLEHPEARRQVVDGCDMHLVVEEMLRFVSPVMHHSRWPLEDIEINGHLIESGQRTTLWMISANRDDQIFTSPDDFDVTRDPNPHDSLGPGGPHFCLGAGLARLEARVLFEEARPYLGRFQLAGDPVRGRNNFFNVLDRCPITVQ